MKILVGFIRKIGIKNRMVVTFSFLIILTSIIGTISINRLDKISNKGLESVTSLSISNDIFDLFSSIDTSVYNLTNTKEHIVMNNVSKTLHKSIDDLELKKAELLAQLDENSKIFTNGEIQDIKNLFLIYETNYLPVVYKMEELSLQNKDEESHLISITDGDFYHNSIKYITAMAYDKNMNGTYESAYFNKNSADMSKTFIIIILSFSIVFAILLAFIIVKSISKPMKNLRSIAKKVSKGNFDVDVDISGKDDISDLSFQFKNLIEIFDDLTLDMLTVATKQQQGDWGAFLDSDKYEGNYKKMADVFNNMCKSQIDTTTIVINCIKEIGAGNFSAKIEQLPGDKKVYNELINGLSQNLQGVFDKIHILVLSALKGNLSTRVSSVGLLGDWANIITDLNFLLEIIDKPFKEYSYVLVEMAKGNLNVCVNGEYEGDFKVIKDNLNNTITQLSSYIHEISSALSYIANDDLTHCITREYMGDFYIIKESINDIFVKLNDVFVDIYNSANEVKESSSVISEGSARVANGASKQSSSIEELSCEIDLINDMTKSNDKNSTYATTLSLDTMKNAQTGDEQMKLLLDAMLDIKDASNNISNIIHLIEDIASQTNLLAINAAIEAARAGVHGKGFAIVAEQVRELAGKSKQAAGQSSIFIEDTISKVQIGNKLSKTTAQSLSAIVENVTSVSDIVGKISSASKEQSASLEQITIGLRQISEVVYINTAESEESAASSEQLLSQSEILLDMVSTFKLIM